MTLDIKLPVKQTGFLGPDWLSESIRITIFGPPQDAPAPFWSKFTDEEPSEIVRRPTEGILNEVGPFGGGNLIIAQQSGRSDIILAPSIPVSSVRLTPTEHIPDPDIHHIGPAAPALSLMLKGIPRLAPKFEGANRIAFSMAFLFKVKSNAEANAVVRAFENLPIGSNDSDIYWRINRPISADTFSGNINRLVSWQTASFQTQRVLLSQNRAIQKSAPTLPTFFTRVEIEVNSAKLDTTDMHQLESWEDTFKEIFTHASNMITKEV
ncbi:hypothetical protein FE249_00795 [Acidiphilium multivorum]|uniref:hypothetical protein n=1 Tax=Acidiphilium multivorum TaxID=62140 RepID=UPI001F4C29B3|nr:hypothetical protein [Acidiphilium multivorum]UNC12866.1 hypothetical protein FE249_00795 [Acidiphilium multivorum]